ncbi:hypothetical protein K5X82_18025 [Halosquirtibacter xylanolyticus]|uniref:MvdC/MvdD family ATP grasp protein n=1 Tax=Halosquirtibacter xylanolyticus TaxID=3374599 RepID=UPI003747C564|nr:hypothetical protein K5X82_18025 [Prolixibacteraceae bacterium]
METKVLLITNKEDVTTNYVEEELKCREISYYRFNTEELTKSVHLDLDLSNSQQYLYDDNLECYFDLRSFSSVYFRRAVLPCYSNEELSDDELFFVNNENKYTLEGIYKLLRGANWISSLFAIREAENKIYQLDIAKRIGFTIPDSIVSNRYKSLSMFFNRNDYDCIIKPIHSGRVGCSNKLGQVFTNKIEDLGNKDQMESYVNFLQKHIRKKGDIRVTVVGNKFYSVFIDSQRNLDSEIDWRKDQDKLIYSRHSLPDNIETMCISLLAKLNLGFGAIDFILTEDDSYVFLEINPNGQWAWVEMVVGYNIKREIVNGLVYGT